MTFHRLAAGTFVATDGVRVVDTRWPERPWRAVATVGGATYQVATEKRRGTTDVAARLVVALPGEPADAVTLRVTFAAS